MFAFSGSMPEKYSSLLDNLLNSISTLYLDDFDLKKRKQKSFFQSWRKLDGDFFHYYAESKDFYTGEPVFLLLLMQGTAAKAV